jgi:hypothetical protein
MEKSLGVKLYRRMLLLRSIKEEPKVDAANQNKSYWLSESKKSGEEENKSY